MIGAGAALDLQDEDGMSALMDAASNGYTEIELALIKAGARLDLKSRAGLATVPIPPELAVVPVPMGPALPEGGVAQLPVDDIPGWFFATNGYFSLPMKGLENFFALVHDVTGAPW